MKRRKAETEAEIADFWLTHDSAGVIDWSAEGVTLRFDPDAERPTQTVTLRLPRQLVRALHVLAKKRDVSDASLVKMLLTEKVAELLRGRAA
jgi:hypothetical protein